VLPAGVAIFLAATGSCSSPGTSPAPSVADAFRQRANAPAALDPPGTEPVASDDPAAPSDSSPIATVDGRPIARRRVVDLLLRAHGAGVLEQLIVLEAAERLAADRGLTVTESDLHREYDDALRQLVDPLAELTSGPFDRERAEQLLEAVLARRNISKEEFRLGVRRNACLRRLAEADVAVTDELFRAEYDRRYGERVQVRHIQVATPGEVTRVQQRLSAGEPFAEVAQQLSANLISGKNGGQLEPFSLGDDRVPPALREAAAGLSPGTGPTVVQIGEWYQLVELERRLPPAKVALAEVRDELERSLRRRLAEPAMRDLYERLFRGANVVIHDPVLRETFSRKHPDRGG